MKKCTRCGETKPLSRFGSTGRQRCDGNEGSRSWCKDCDNAYQRERYARDPGRIREIKRDHMRRMRSTLEGRERQRQVSLKCYRNGGDVRQRERMKNRKENDFFHWHVQYVRRYNPAISPGDLENLWHRQGGQCALTGRMMEAKAGCVQVDHIVPAARGGSHKMSNLRWVIKDANMAKRDLTDKEFLALCEDVAEWIGRRIIEVHQDREENEEDGNEGKEDQEGTDQVHGT